MSSHRGKDSNFLRLCALYEFFEGKSAFKAYESFCKVFGDNAMEYKEFLFWFERFAEGNYDLTCDESLMPKAPSLPDVPIEILEEIVKKTNSDGVIALRQVSQNIRDKVNDIKIVYKEVNVVMEKYSTTLSIDGETRVYERLPTTVNDSDAVKKRANSDYHAFGHLIVLMKHPRIQLEKLCVENNSEWDSYINYSWGLRSFKLEDASLHVKVAHFRSVLEESYVIMKLLKPGTLVEIELVGIGDGTYYEGHTELDQWKQAKILKTGGNEYLSNWTEKFSNFVRFDINIHFLELSYLVELKDTVFKSTTFEKCRLEWVSVQYSLADRFDGDDAVGKVPFRYGPSLVIFLNCTERRLGLHTRKESKDPNYGQYVVKHKNKVFEFKIGLQFIEIERKR